ncbi:MAG: 2-amino-4-hydroxy-6-hydroxymethyldihydropteridine diphosphokinase [Mitsuaria chitosanitabida]|uniref:2-amino-4-hydroxy-6- hydroxymethyldihydropteridine diphosphokinase n=1 Tax=Roseateles chitosanitabidus TaxID=65048 RepID=UPI001B03C7BF|nr:2-amino-4-hydroxy-6-hydroxymethyldihydropteridine diphosphokinase [Roseateles chitosanitabidus]MBO9686365.1 2-amino-4-hydroxy-6-hydroxymethyldihydropteridine diphosphokinase [Roseateles chitosanitabidus]
MITAYVGLGANLGDLRHTLETALADLADVRGVQLDGVSSAWRSAPVDSDGPDYLNAAARVRTDLPPLTLLAALQAIEARHGRERPYRNAPRTLDLDLLLYGDQTVDLDRLVVPHPRLHLRAFVLRPLLELNPALDAPGLGALADFLPATADQVLQRDAQPLRRPHPDA